MEHKGNLFLKEMNGFMLNVTIYVSFSSYLEGGVPAIQDIIYVFL